VDRVTVRWPDGTTQVLATPAADRIHRVVFGEVPR
jgi:hypothetical protein